MDIYLIIYYIFLWFIAFLIYEFVKATLSLYAPQVLEAITFRLSKRRTAKREIQKVREELKIITGEDESLVDDINVIQTNEILHDEWGIIYIKKGTPLSGIQRRMIIAYPKIGAYKRERLFW